MLFQYQFKEPLRQWKPKNYGLTAPKLFSCRLLLWMAKMEMKLENNCPLFSKVLKRSLEKSAKMYGLLHLLKSISSSS